MIIRIAFIFLLLILSSAALSAQDTFPDSLMVADTDTTEIEQPKVERIITPLKRLPPPGYHIALTDSIYRWEQWMNPSEWYHHRSGAITHRLGMFGRNDAIRYRGRGVNHNRLYFEGIPMNNRLTGSANVNRMPWHRMQYVYENQSGALLHTDYYMRDYYVTRPLTLINSEIAADNYRNTEVMLTRNIGRETNLELAWWDKQSAPGYPRNLLAGNQFNAKAYHHLTDNLIVRGGAMRTQLNMNESGGLDIPDMQQFNFFYGGAPANLISTSSEQSEWLVYAGLFHRNDNKQTSENHATIYFNSNSRDYFGADSLLTQHRTFGLMAEHQNTYGFLHAGLRTGAEHTHLPSSTNSLRRISDWFTVYLHPVISLQFGDIFKAGANTHASYNSAVFSFEHSQTEWDATVFAEISLFNKLSIRASQTFAELNQPIFAKMELEHIISDLIFVVPPKMQIESINRQQLSASYQMLSYSQLDIAAWRSSTENAWYYNSDGNFGVFNYDSQGMDFDFKVDTPRFEANASATFLQTNFSAAPEDQLWLRGSVYYKNYIYNRAAFMKLGLRGMLSPFSYRTPAYNPMRDIWGYNSFNNNSPIPAFQRVDIDMSVRVRSAIILLQMENVLGAVTLFVPSYFETAYYPMYPYRFRFGVRWLLRN